MLIDQAVLPSNPGFTGSNLVAWRQLYLNKAKLKAVSRTSALLSGFAMIGMVEITFKDNVNGLLLMLYAINTTLLIAVHLLALMISTCILPNIESVSATMSSVKDSPHQSMNRHIQLAWTFSTVLGILLFFSEVALLCWVKMLPLDEQQRPAQEDQQLPVQEEPHKGRNAAIASTCIVVPAAIAFLAFVCHFYRRLADHKYDNAHRNLEELENIHSGLHNV